MFISSKPWSCCPVWLLWWWEMTSCGLVGGCVRNVKVSWCSLRSKSLWVQDIVSPYLVIIGPGNGLSPWRCQAITWTNADVMSIRLTGRNFNKILIEIQKYSLKNVCHCCSKCWSFCLCLNVSTHWGRVMHICISTLTIIGSDNGLLPIFLLIIRKFYKHSCKKCMYTILFSGSICKIWCSL